MIRFCNYIPNLPGAVLYFGCSYGIANTRVAYAIANGFRGFANPLEVSQHLRDLPLTVSGSETVYQINFNNNPTSGYTIQSVLESICTEAGTLNAILVINDPVEGLHYCNSLRATDHFVAQCLTDITQNLPGSQESLPPFPSNNPSNYWAQTLR